MVLIQVLRLARVTLQIGGIVRHRMFEFDSSVILAMGVSFRGQPNATHFGWL